MTKDVDDDGVQPILVSEKGLIVNNYAGIHLYHIPGLRAVGNNPNLDPVWSWRGDASRYRSTLCKTASPYPALWLQGEWATHTLEFNVDESGFPTVANHHIMEGKPAYYMGDHFKQQGRKGMGIDIDADDEQSSEVVLKTGVLGKPDITRELRARLPGRYDGPWIFQDEVKYTDLDEVTGRIMIVIGTCTMRDGWGRNAAVPYAQLLCLADLPM